MLCRESAIYTQARTRAKADSNRSTAVLYRFCPMQVKLLLAAPRFALQQSCGNMHRSLPERRQQALKFLHIAPVSNNLCLCSTYPQRTASLPPALCQKCWPELTRTPPACAL